MKVLALNLPQFHEVAENNEWWGKGFTEWTNVKKAKPLYKGHVQPMVPLEGYYDLSKVEAINHQAELAKAYGVYGFVYFHYWYEGRKMLEKPCEILLYNKQININYCFYIFFLFFFFLDISNKIINQFCLYIIVVSSHM